jgi:hypothetical protein
MAAGATYFPIATQTLGSAAASYTFTSIPTTYTDLILVFNGSEAGGSTPELRVGNGSIDTGNNYGWTYMAGTGSSAITGRSSNADSINPAFNPTTNSRYIVIYHFMNYSNTTTHKTTLIRANDTTGRTVAEVALWRNTAAINQIRIYDPYNNINAGSTFTLYGIEYA